MPKNSKVVAKIREMIVNGEFQPGQRLREVEIAKQLGVSRTPVREALPTLAQEGVLRQLDTRGFVVREFPVNEIRDALEVRGALEGLAARLLAEQGVPRRLLQSMRECLAEGDDIFAKGYLVEADEVLYSNMNQRLHALIIQGSGSKVIADALAHNGRIPYAAPHITHFDKKDMRRTFDGFLYVHRQHHAIVEALEHGEGDRVASLMYEHAYSSKEISDNVARGSWRPNAHSAFVNDEERSGAPKST